MSEMNTPRLELGNENLSSARKPREERFRQTKNGKADGLFYLLLTEEIWVGQD